MMNGRSDSSSSASVVDDERRSNPRASPSLAGLSVAVVGAGPAGLLLAHRLAQAGATKVDVFERRPRYQSVVGNQVAAKRVAAKAASTSQQRAYALGIGIRGRTALQEADGDLWDRVVKPIGYESGKFIVHTPIAGLQLTLRDSQRNTSSKKDETEEPSLLVYQSDLCRVLADALIHYSSQPDRTVVQLQFDCAVSNVDLFSNTITVTETTRLESSTAASTKSHRLSSSYDLIVGCDGVNSVVRRAMQDTYGPVGFQSTATPLPGVFKVARLPRMPPQLDPTAVQLLLPKSGTATAFLEPVVDEGCCLLIAGNNETDVLLKSHDNLGDDALTAVVTTIEEELRRRFPQMQGDGTGLHEAAIQLATARPGRASKVSCNIYHARSACLVGDAAHATGGVSGQGLNSALVDVNVLVDCLLRRYQQDDDDDDDDEGDNTATTTKGRKASSLHAALLEYSQRAVPEGTALAALSFGGRGNVWTAARDFLFGGRIFGIGQPLLQTQLTSSRRPFAAIRRARQSYFNVDDVFPSPQEWDAQLQPLHETILAASNVTMSDNLIRNATDPPGGIGLSSLLA